MAAAAQVETEGTAPASIGPSHRSSAWLQGSPAAMWCFFTRLLWLNRLYSTMVADVIPGRSRITGGSDVSTRVGMYGDTNIGVLIPMNPKIHQLYRGHSKQQAERRRRTEPQGLTGFRTLVGFECFRNWGNTQKLSY